MLDAIEKKFDPVAIKYGQMRLYQYCDAISIMQECESQNKKILGFDTFRLFSHGIQPIMSYSYDYSNLPKSCTWNKAITDIRPYATMDFVFEVIYE